MMDSFYVVKLGSQYCWNLASHSGAGLCRTKAVIHFNASGWKELAEKGYEIVQVVISEKPVHEPD